MCVLSSFGRHTGARAGAVHVGWRGDPGAHCIRTALVGWLELEQVWASWAGGPEVHGTQAALIGWMKLRWPCQGCLGGGGSRLCGPCTWVHSDSLGNLTTGPGLCSCPLYQGEGRRQQMAPCAASSASDLKEFQQFLAHLAGGIGLVNKFTSCII